MSGAAPKDEVKNGTRGDSSKDAKGNDFEWGNESKTVSSETVHDSDVGSSLQGNISFLVSFSLSSLTSLSPSPPLPSLSSQIFSH